MPLGYLNKFENYYLKIKANLWYWLFALFCRLTLALGFIIAGMVKILDERFASGLSEIHPMGAYLEALHHTGYYYTFIGVAQVLAAILLLIPRTAVLGALLYFPIILNICILSFAVRFDGSFVSAPLMVLANIYLLVWHYDKLRFLLPSNRFSDFGIINKRPKTFNKKFPWKFALGVVLTTMSIVLLFGMSPWIMPRNSLSDCQKQFLDTPIQAEGFKFCECIHVSGSSLDSCMEILVEETSE